MNDDWTEVECVNCMHGMVWSARSEATSSPDECTYCLGTGRLQEHYYTGTLRIYPGGSLAGSVKPKASALEQAVYKLREKHERSI